MTSIYNHPHYTAQEILGDELSDKYKAIHGMRPRFYDFDAMTVAELESEIESLGAYQCVSDHQAEVCNYTYCGYDYAGVAACMSYGATDVAMALQWLAE